MYCTHKMVLTLLLVFPRLIDSVAYGLACYGISCGGVAWQSYELPRLLCINIEVALFGVFANKIESSL